MLLRGKEVDVERLMEVCEVETDDAKRTFLWQMVGYGALSAEEAFEELARRGLVEVEQETAR